MRDMKQITPTMPRIAQDMAFFEMGGTRYLVMPLGPAPVFAEEGHKAAQMSPMPVPDPAKDAAADVATSPESDGRVPSKYAYGLKGIQTIFNCSKSTASSIKRSGRIDEAISQIGNTIVVDVEKALELLKK